MQEDITVAVGNAPSFHLGEDLLLLFQQQGHGRQVSWLAVLRVTLQIADNRFYNNQHHGIRFRNSLDVTLKDNLILQNGHYGIYGYLSDLSAHAPLPGHEARDLKLDPYEMRGSGYISGGVIALNGSGALFTTGLEAVEIGKLALDENGKRREITLGGDLVPYTDVISTVWYGDVNEVLFSRAVSTKRSNARNSVSLEVANE